MQYKVYGQGPLLIFLPGLDGTGELFYRQIPELSRHFQVVTASLRTEGDFTYGDLVGDIENAIKELNYDRAFICGESFGGSLALQFASARPEMVERLTIINSFPYFRNRLLLTAGRVLLEFTPIEFLSLGRRAAVSLGLIAESLTREDLDKFVAITTKVPKLAIARRMNLVAKHDVRGKLPDIQTRTLLIATQKDRLQNSVAEAEFMASKMPNARVRVVKGMGHIFLPSPDFSLSSVFEEEGFLPERREAD